MKMLYSRICLALSASLAFSAAITSASAAQTIVIVESRGAGKNYANYHELSGNWADSTAKATLAAGVTPGIGSRFATLDNAAFSVNPVLEDGQTYVVDIAHGTSSSIPNNLTNSISVIGGTGLPVETTVFSRLPENIWERVGILVLDAGVTQPTITFTKPVGSQAGRFYADAVRFTKFDPCFNSLQPLLTVNGPLAAGQTFVDVPGVTNTATRVRVYADSVLVGDKSSGVTAGVNRVALTTPLAKGQIVTVTQSGADGVESCRPDTGPSVGGGPNPNVRVALSIRQNTALTGPIGGNGGSASTIIKFLGATGVVNNVNGNAPAGNRVFTPSTDWQTVEFLRGPDPASPVDPTYMWNGTDTAPANQLRGNFGVLDSIVLSIDGTDNGPYEIYIDNFKNGSTMIQDFEGGAPGSQTGMLAPSFSGTTSGFLLSPAPGTISPNVGIVTNNVADGGSHSFFVSFQFKDTNRLDWVRWVAQGAGTPNPMLDLNQPISFRMLLLPVGQQPPPSAPVFSAGPASQTVVRGGSTTMRVNVRGTAPLRYQWLLNGVEIANATNSTLTRANVQPADGGQYTVRVTNDLGSDTSPAGTLTVEDVPYTDIMTPMWKISPGQRPYLANDNNSRSIAYNSISGNLLVASRTGSNAIHVLDGNTGAYLHTLQAPIGGYTGGALALNLVACTDDGSVYAANVTDDGVTNNFRLYKWLGDAPEEIGAVVWEGNPSSSVDIHARWGDAMVIQGPTGDHEVLLTSRTGAYISSIRPDFGGAFAQLMDATGAASSSLRTGLALDGVDTVWGKHLGLPLTRVTLDPNRLSATVAQTLSGVDNMTAIGIDPTSRILAGVFVENPDNLRLFGIGANGLTPLDTELFPADNANGNATGAVAFGLDRVYALDSNNGLMAMSLNLACLPDKLSIQRDGAYAIISWNRLGQRLQGTAELGSGQWEEIAGPNQTSASVGAASGIKFFRLICP